MTPPDKIALARKDAAAARGRFIGTTAILKARLMPKALAHGALQEMQGASDAIARSGLAAVKKKPAAIVGVAAAIGLFLVRRPLARLMGKKRKPLRATKVEHR